MDHFFVDLHCDTLMMLLITDPERGELYRAPKAMVDLERMVQGKCMAQCFAIFMPQPDFWTEHRGLPPMDDETYIATLYGYYQKALAEHGDLIAPARSAAEIRANHAAGKMSAVLTMEDGRPVQGRLEQLDRYHAMGIRAISLTWNAANCFGFPNSTDPAAMARGLTPFGKEAVEYMQELGILVDVSHLSDGGFWDVAERCKKPFIATHSNCRALAGHPRNLTDEMIRALADKGGVAGINFASEFLNADPGDRRSTVAAMARHARHMADVGGVGVVALGSDLDGISSQLEIGSSAQMPLLADGLKGEGFTENEIDLIYHGNALRVFAETMG